MLYPFYTKYHDHLLCNIEEYKMGKHEETEASEYPLICNVETEAC